MERLGESWLIGHQVVVTHHTNDCQGKNCVLHNPSNHHMREWPATIRLDRFGLIERHCAHGIGHPDPDSAAFIEMNGQDDPSVHGCDGCCTNPPTKEH